MLKKKREETQKDKAPKASKGRKEVEKRAEVLVNLFTDGKWRSYKEINEATGYDHSNRAMTAVRQAGYIVETARFHNPETGKKNLVKVRILGKIPGKSPIVRTSISASDKTKLFVKDKYMCNLCKVTFLEKDLRPDHRKSFIKHGETVFKTDPNWMDKLQTLCHWCNYEKREICSKCTRPDCDQCPLAHPEDMNMLPVKLTKEEAKSLEKVCTEKGISKQDFINNLIRSTLGSL